MSDSWDFLLFYVIFTTTGDSPVLMTDTTQQCNTAQQIQRTNQEVMIVIIKLKHEVAEMANQLSCAFKGLFFFSRRQPHPK